MTFNSSHHGLLWWFGKDSWVLVYEILHTNNTHVTEYLLYSSQCATWTKVVRFVPCHKAYYNLAERTCIYKARRNQCYEIQTRGIQLYMRGLPKVHGKYM